MLDGHPHKHGGDGSAAVQRPLCARRRCRFRSWLSLLEAVRASGAVIAAWLVVDAITMKGFGEAVSETRR